MKIHVNISLITFFQVSITISSNSLHLIFLHSTVIDDVTNKVMSKIFYSNSWYSFELRQVFIKLECKKKH